MNRMFESSHLRNSRAETRVIVSEPRQFVRWQVWGAVRGNMTLVETYPYSEEQTARTHALSLPAGYVLRHKS